jgi:hypothetical protein
MSYTGKKIFDMSISVIDELSESGSVNADDVKEYSNRAPGLLNLWQSDVAYLLEAVTEYENTNEEARYKWTKATLPSDYREIKEITFFDEDSLFRTIDYKIIGNEDIYLYYTKKGKAILTYIPFPTEITALTQTIQADDVTALSGAYFLAEHFANADQNDELARLCNIKYNILKAQALRPKPLSSVETIDCYGGG